MEEITGNINLMLKPLQTKKGQKRLWCLTRKQSFSLEKDCFLSGTSNFFGPSYFEMALNIPLMSCFPSASTELTVVAPEKEIG